MIQALIPAAITAGLVFGGLHLVGWLFGRWHKFSRGYHISIIVLTVLAAAYSYFNYLGR